MEARAGSVSAPSRPSPLWFWSCGCVKQEDLDKGEQFEVSEADTGKHWNEGDQPQDSIVAAAAQEEEAVPAAKVVVESSSAEERVAEADLAPHDGDEDEQVLRRVRYLCAHEAHLRAVAALEAHAEALKRDGPPGAEEEFRAKCEGDEDVVRLRWKEKVLRAARRNLGYEKEEQGEGTTASSTYYKIGSGAGSAELWAWTNGGTKPTFLIKSFFAEPVDHILSLYTEIDLYPLWLPFVWEAKRINVVRGCGDYAQFIILLRYCLPWPLKNREAIVYGFGTENLEDGKVILCASSVPDGATEWWGYPIPPAGSAIRMDVGFEVGFRTEGPAGENTHMDFRFQVDPKVDWLPPSFLGWAGRQLVTLLYGNVSGICKKFGESQYPARVKADENGTYGLIDRSLKAHRKGYLPEEAPES